MIYREAAARGESLVNQVKRADQRARLYGLEDDGASDLAQLRRYLKDRIATLRRIIAELRTGKQAQARGLVRDPDVIARNIAAHEKRIIELRAELDGLPTLGTLAPMTRRVAREDRKRRRKKGPTIVLPRIAGNRRLAHEMVAGANVRAGAEVRIDARHCVDATSSFTEELVRELAHRRTARAVLVMGPPALIDGMARATEASRLPLDFV